MLSDDKIIELAKQEWSAGDTYIGPDIRSLIRFARLIEQKTPALERFTELGGGEEADPVERLRFFCSLALSGQDWLDVEPFIDDVAAAVGKGMK